MNRARLRELGFELSARADAGESDHGVLFATAPDGARVVLKWFPEETVMAARIVGVFCARALQKPSESSIRSPRRR